MGFRKLGKEKADLVETVKHLSQEISGFLDELEQKPDIDKEGLKIATNQLEEGISSLVEAITIKKFIWL